MIHIKSINKFFESIDEDDLKDICQELEDKRFTIRLEREENQSKYPRNVVYIYQKRSYQGVPAHRNKGYKFSEIKEYVLRLKDYLGDKFLYAMYSDPYEKKEKIWKKIILNDESKIDKKIQSFGVYYKD